MTEAGSSLYFGRVMHHRLRPFRHRFSYRVFSIWLDVDRVGEDASRLRLFSHNRFNLFSFHDKDHGRRDGGPLRPWVEALLAGDGGGLGLDGLASPPLWLAGLAVGVALRGPSMYLTFWSINAVGTHNYLAAVAFLPLVGQAFEYLLALGGWLPMPAIDVYDVCLIAAIIGGACLILRVGRTA